ncbi:MAG: hypothetical protein AAF526_03070 [Pseudomonadota bacterium]
MRALLVVLLAGGTALTAPSALAVPAPLEPPAQPRSAAYEADIIEKVACGPRCRTNRRVSRRTARRTSRRVSARHNYYGGGCCYDNGPNAAAVGIAAGVAGLAVGAAIASSAKNNPPPVESYP